MTAITATITPTKLRNGSLVCSCGDPNPHVIARRATADGKHVCLWSDGGLTWALGMAIRGAWLRPGAKNRDRALRAGWLVLGEVCLYDQGEVSALAAAARWAADRDGLPGTMRARLRSEAHRLTPDWRVIRTNRDGAPTERVWVLPRMLGTRLAVWDYCTRGGSRGRYDVCASARGDDCYETTGMRFRTQPEMLAYLEDCVRLQVSATPKAGA